jgi:hypothetical protein
MYMEVLISYKYYYFSHIQLALKRKTNNVQIISEQYRSKVSEQTSQNIRVYSADKNEDALKLKCQKRERERELHTPFS